MARVDVAIGKLLDYVKVPYVFGKNTIMAHLNSAYYHVHGQSFVYPNHADAVELTAAAGAWAITGDIIEIIPANTLSLSAFDLHWAYVTAISANSEIQIDVFMGAEGEEEQIDFVCAERTTVTEPGSPQPMQVGKLPKNTRISARLSSGVVGATTCNFKVKGHYYA